jgi:plasmid stabilization system protein ParE
MADPEILPEAMEDIQQAYDWYEERESGLGEKFIRCLDDCLLSIRRIPMGYAKVYRNYRRAVVRRFPYVVFYKALKKKVIVYSVFHCSQNPDKWRKRLS